MNLSPEQQLVLELAQFRHVNREKIGELTGQLLDWNSILGYLLYNRLTGIAYRVLQECQPIPLNHEINFLLFMNYEIQKLRTENNLTLITELSKGLNERQISHAFLKGAVLSSSTYPLGFRVSKDIDLLVRAKDLTNCGKVLQELGYVQGFYDSKTDAIQPASRKEVIFRRMNLGEIVPYQKVVNAPGLFISEVDVNFSLDCVAQGTEDAVDQFLSHAELHPITEDLSIHSLPKEYFLAHLCAHLYKEAVVLNWVEWQRDLLLYKFLDIYAYITDPERKMDWKRFATLVKKNNLIKETYYALTYAKVFFPALNEDIDFKDMLDEIHPVDTEYMNQVVDAKDASKIYVWKDEILTRFFDMKRYRQLIAEPVYE